MCGAGTCRGFIGKRRAPPPLPKAPVVKKRKTAVSKTKPIVQGRIRKRFRDHVKIIYDNRKIRATIYHPYSRQATNSRKETKIDGKKPQLKAKKTSKFKNVDTKSKTVVNVSTTTKSTVLGKRKRPSPTEKKGKPSSVSPKMKDTIVSGRNIAKPPPKKIAVRFAKSINPARSIFDTVSHRSRNTNVH